MLDDMSLLPPNRTKMETAISGAVEFGNDIVPELMGFLNIPEEIGSPLLPWLGWAFDVPAWPSEKEKQRWICKNSWDLHKKQGTVSCLKSMAALAGTSIVKIETPPGTVFCNSSMTEAEKKSFVAMHPAIISRPWIHEGKKAGMFTGDFPGSGDSFPAKSDSIARIGDRVDYYDPLTGQETHLEFLSITKKQILKTAYENVLARLHGKAFGWFCGIVPSKPYTLSTDAANRYYTISLERPYTETEEVRSNLAITPSLEPVTGSYEQIREKGMAAGIFPGMSIHGNVAKTDAAMRISKLLRLYDPSRVGELVRRKASFYTGTRLGGLKAHQAVISIDASSKKPTGAICPSRAAFTGCGAAMGLGAGDRVSRILNVMGWGTRLSDRISVNPSPYHMTKISPAARIGKTGTGQYILEAI